ncbi:MAG: hypothetical protein IKJ81_05425 [Bacteroidales bacterium]|nr:hypothetical protein [Bacteroidales bacterium]
MIYRLTKSKFILGLQCEKALYLDVYRPQLARFTPETLARFRKGRDFEASVKATFTNGLDVSKILGKQISKYPEYTTAILTQPGEQTLFEAGFVFDEVLILADVVHKDNDGNVSIFEIKNSTSVKDVFRRDVCIQNYVIGNSIEKMCENKAIPLRMKSFSILYNNGDNSAAQYDMTAEAEEAKGMIAKQVARFKEVLQNLEPTMDIGEQCTKPYECPYILYCKGKQTVQLELGDLQ